MVEYTYTNPLNEHECALVNAAADAVNLKSKALKSPIRAHVGGVFILRNERYADGAGGQWTPTTSSSRKISVGEMIDLILNISPELLIAGYPSKIDKDFLTVGCERVKWEDVERILEHRDLAGKELAEVTNGSGGARFFVKNVQHGESLKSFTGLHTLTERRYFPWGCGRFHHVTDVFIPGLTPDIKIEGNPISIDWDGVRAGKHFADWKSIEKIYDRRNS